MKFRTFEEIPVWQDAHQLTLEVYTATQGYPSAEKYGLVSQTRRSSASVPANIVEGFYRRTTKELISFIINARASAGETIYHLTLARDLEYISQEDYKELRQKYESIIKQLNAWMKSLRH